jgi:hypothetical protein
MVRMGATACGAMDCIIGNKTRTAKISINNGRFTPDKWILISFDLQNSGRFGCWQIYQSRTGINVYCVEIVNEIINTYFCPCGSYILLYAGFHHLRAGSNAFRAES